MNDLVLESLTQRMDRLERQNRALKAMALLALAALTAVVCMGQVGVPAVIEAGKLVLRDGDGNKRAVWAAEGAETTLTLYDAQGAQRVRIAAHETDGGTLSLKGGHEARLSERALEFVTPPGGASAKLSPGALTVGHYLGGMVEITDRGVELYESEGVRHPERRRRARLVVAPEAPTAELAPSLALYDAQGRPRLRAALAEDGTPVLCLCDAAGKWLFSAP